jgi:cytochrome b
MIRAVNTTAPTSADTPVRVWDLPVRLTHWLLVACIAVSWWTAEERQMEWHRYSGYALLGLLVFRVYWGFAGSSTARFSDFLRGPRKIVEYLRQPRTQRAVPGLSGHNPLGGWSVIAMLALMALQVGIGLFVSDVDGLESGPLSHLVSFDTSRTLAELHETLFNVLLTFIALHVAAVIFYLLYLRDNLIAAMVSGRHERASQGMSTVPVWRVLPGIAIAATVVWIIAS